MENRQSITLRKRIANLSACPELTAALVAHQCRQDPDFALSLGQNPRKALAQLNGSTLPQGLHIKVHTNTDDAWHLPLPDPSTEAMVLDDEQMQKIQAGEALYTFGAFFAVASVGVALAVSGLGVGVAALVKDIQ